ncbi:acetyltransferase [Colwelliaceae bacterium 6471]
MTRLIIIGAGGHGRVIADCAHAMGQYSSIAFLDDSYPERADNLTFPIIDKTGNWQNYLDYSEFVIGIGDNRTRLHWFEQLHQAQATLPNIIHPSAVISSFSALGQGNVVFANAVINPNVTIKNACIVNTAASVDHDCQLDDAVHISPGVNIAGTVVIHQLCWIGVGSCVSNNLTLAKNTQTGAGAVIIDNTLAHSLYVGNPAKPIKSID